MLQVSRLLRGFSGSAQLPLAFRSGHVVDTVSRCHPTIRTFAAGTTANAMHDWVKLLKDPELFKEQCFIGGEWVDAVDGETIDVRPPYLPNLIRGISDHADVLSEHLHQH